MPAKVSNIPPKLLEARSTGAANENESTPLSERDPVGAAPVVASPLLDVVTGAYAPAEYSATIMVPVGETGERAIVLTRRDR